MSRHGHFYWHKTQFDYLLGLALAIRVACFAIFFFFLVASVNSFNSFVYYCCIFFVIWNCMYHVCSPELGGNKDYILCFNMLCQLNFETVKVHLDFHCALVWKCKATYITDTKEYAILNVVFVLKKIKTQFWGERLATFWIFLTFSQLYRGGQY